MLITWLITHILTRICRKNMLITFSEDCYVKFGRKALFCAKYTKTRVDFLLLKNCVFSCENCCQYGII